MTFRRYFGMITTWYLHSHRTWDRLCHSCIGSSFLPHGAFPEGGAYAVLRELHAGSLEAHWVTRPEAVDLGRINVEPIPGVIDELCAQRQRDVNLGVGLMTGLSERHRFRYDSARPFVNSMIHRCSEGVQGWN